MGVEATGGFEPPNRGFADLRLRPLGYVAWERVGAEEETRTPTALAATAPSTLRVYQFHHLGTPGRQSDDSKRAPRVSIAAAAVFVGMGHRPAQDVRGGALPPYQVRGRLFDPSSSSGEPGSGRTILCPLWLCPVSRYCWVFFRSSLCPASVSRLSLSGLLVCSIGPGRALTGWPAASRSRNYRKVPTLAGGHLGPPLPSRRVDLLRRSTDPMRDTPRSS